LPLGTYVPAFHWPTPRTNEREQGRKYRPLAAEKSERSSEAVSATIVPAASPHKSKTKLLFAGSTVASVLLAGLFGLLFVFAYFDHAHSEVRALDAFWAPLRDKSDAILVCAGDLNLIMNVHPTLSDENETWRDVTKNQNHLDPNMGAALLHVGTAMGRKGKRVRFRLADLTPCPTSESNPTSSSAAAIIPGPYEFSQDFDSTASLE